MSSTEPDHLTPESPRNAFPGAFLILCRNSVCTATTVQVVGGKGGKLVYTDGPFAETKEVLGGLYLIEAADLDEALK